MSELTKITRRDGGKDFQRATGDIHPFQLVGFHGMVLEVEDVHFHFDSAVLMPDFADCDQVVDEADRNRVTGLAAIRAAYRHAKANPGQKMIVTGHTDRSGSADYNLKLSEQRGDSVRADLINRGIAANRLTILGAGQSEPKASNKTLEGRAINRRVELTRTDR